MNVTKCCCFPLRTGVLIIGGLLLTGNWLGLMGSLRGLSQLELSQQRFRQPFVDEKTELCDEKCVENFNKLYLTLAITSLVFQLLNIVIGSMMIFGVYRNLAWCLRPFLVMSGLQITAMLLLWIIGLFLILDLLGTIVLTLVMAIPTCIAFYFALVVKSYMDEISGRGLHGTIEYTDAKYTLP